MKPGFWRQYFMRTHMQVWKGWNPCRALETDSKILQHQGCLMEQMTALMDPMSLPKNNQNWWRRKVGVWLCNPKVMSFMQTLSRKGSNNLPSHTSELLSKNEKSHAFTRYLGKEFDKAECFCDLRLYSFFYFTFDNNCIHLCTNNEYFHIGIVVY